jgi:Ni,Fe-hydrogenase maturation factor
VDRVVFVDVDALRSVRITPGSSDGLTSHRGEPAALLSLAATVGEVPWEVTLVSIPAENLGLGFDLSERTSRAVFEAVDLIEGMARG